MRYKKMIKKEINEKLDLFYATHNIRYIDKGHKYTLDGVTCAGVSTISEYMPKPQLLPWALKLMYEFLEGKLENIKEFDQVLFEALLKEAKGQSYQVSKEALRVGIKSHDWFEAHINGKDLPIDEDIKNPVKAFLAFEKDHKPEWIATEKIVCSPEYLVAGRLDGLCILNGKLTLIDFKTSKQIRESYYLQCMGYAMCLEEMGITVEQKVILRTPKNGDDYEAVIVDTDPEKDKRAFLAQREAYGWANYVDCKFKEKVGYYKQLKLKQL